MKMILNITTFIILFTSLIFAQLQSSNQWESKYTGSQTKFNRVFKKPGHEAAEDWATMIDTTWGDGLSTTEKLAFFDDAYDLIDQEFPCFQGLPESILDSLRQLYRPEIEAGVSHGRFVAIMNYFVMALKEGHSWLVNEEVNFNTPLKPGVPLFVIGAWTDNSHFGATLTPLPDSTLLVIKTLPNHPLGLIPGDIILGYDGIAWKEQYKDILSAQLPLFAVFPYCTAEKAFTHDMLKNAGMNWHLFDTLDVVKYSSGDTMHYSTALLADQSGNLGGNEQLEIPGVPFPDIDWEGVFNFDIFELENYVSWGIVEGTNIGYIYVYGWFTPDQAPGSNISEEFYQAVDTLMNYYKVNGLIFDGRHCFGGGGFDTEDKGFSLLFNSYIETIAYDTRCNPTDHFLMCPHPTFTPTRLAIPGNPANFFDRPIAMLTGPGAMSHGDVIPLKVTFHPMARLFGKSTSGAFSTYRSFQPRPGWWAAKTNSNAYFVSNPGHYLSRAESHVDEEIWFKQEDAANGEDTVVKRAIEWIQNLAYAHDAEVDKTYVIPNSEVAVINTIVENPNQHDLSVTAELNDMDDIFIDSLNLFDDGMHEDGAANDNIWGTSYLPMNEQYYKISVSTSDLTEETSRILPNIAWFSTIGPIVIDGDSIISSDKEPNPGDDLYFRFKLKNKGMKETAKSIKAKLIALDTCASLISTTLVNYGDIAPGETIFGNSSQRVHFSDQCSTVYQTQFAMEIYSNGYHFWSDTFSIDVTPTSIETLEDRIPNEFTLHQNYPNPFNPSTTIKFNLPKSEFVTLKIYSILGEEVVTLIQDKLKAGDHNYQFDGSDLASGVYMYRIEAGEYRQVKKMILIK